MDKKDRIYIVEDDQQPLFTEKYFLTVIYGRRNSWLRRKHIHCDSFSDKEKKISEIDRTRKNHGYQLEEMG
jgi:hypothetical protein